MSHFFMLIVLLALFGCGGLDTVRADNNVRANNNDQVDYLELAARLIADGNYGRAEAALRNLDPQTDEQLDQGRYYTLSGLVLLRRERAGEAIETLQKALEILRRKNEAEPPAGEAQAEARERERQRVHLYLAQAHLQEANFREALTALDEAGETGAAIAMVHALRAQAHFELREYAAAFDALENGARRFPDDHRFLRRKVFYLIELGFYQRAAELGRHYLTITDAAPDDHVAIGSALRKSGQPEMALTLLERARLSYPHHRNIAVELTHAWLDQQRPRAAAEVLATAAIHHPDLRVEAAELQRRAGRLYRALLINSAIDDQQRKLRQRLAILVSMARWDQAAVMGDALYRAGLMDSDEIRYAYAYALFKAGDYNASDSALDGIGGGQLFRKATELRQAMDRCREARWRCL